jgi:hypothetical protein
MNTQYLFDTNEAMNVEIKISAAIPVLENVKCYIK